MRRTLGVACALCVVFSVNVILYMLFVSYGLVLFTIHSFMHLTVRGCGKVNCGKINSTLLQGAGLYIAKNKNPFW